MEITEEAVIVNSSRLKSIVWNDFDRVKKGDTFGAVCRHCKRILSGSSTSGTSHLRNHLIRCRRRSNHDISQLLTRGKRKQTTLAIANFSYNESAVRNEMVTVASTNVEQGAEVRNMNVGVLNLDQRRSQLDLALNGIEADCIDIYKKEKQRVYEELYKLPGKVSLSADRWAMNRGSDYLCLVAYYIDDSWKVKKKILDFLSVDPSEGEDMLSELIMTSLRNWDIDRKIPKLQSLLCLSMQNSKSLGSAFGIEDSHGFF
ncbi:zinc finger BED domain-containing protein RICESLEEPER 1-like isoform X1 [Salvia divinorum]|uniref:Zinc finger BED domain-containing protein RICESLEEPER 1-like isoform X1 n=1 Tax=Salvia divinorum TaxID=28513 RepID=A0ABD1HKT9_SALDI